MGQAAASTMTPDDATRLGGEVGDADVYKRQDFIYRIYLLHTC